jgi:hypothetical protein
VIVTLETEFAQGGLEIVHAKTLAPIPKPVMLLVGERELLITPVPDTRVHEPLPTVGLLAAIVVVGLKAQIVWFGPALANDGAAFVVIVIFETEEAQGELLIDQVKTVNPGVNPVIEDVGERELVIMPDPETLIQLPIPIEGALAARTVDPAVTQTVWLEPAFEIVGAAIPVIVTFEIEFAQGELEMLH